MSDVQNHNSLFDRSDGAVPPARQTARDRGITLPELLIVVSIVGLIVAVLSTSVIVTLRQNDNTEGRINVARAEQNVGMWMPADLASANVVDTSPNASPCGAAVCDGIVLSNGSNVLMLTWTIDGPGGVTSTTNVSYHFTQLPDGEYVLWRVECTDGSCSVTTVLDDLPGPPAGAPFVPGVLHGDACTAEIAPVECTRPDWVIIVSEPLAPDAVDENDVVTDSDSEIKDANRVIVTINGGGDSDGAGGGINQISITAGGTVRTEIDADSIEGAPTFIEARSRCGGPITLVIDESNSIGGAIDNVEAGVRTFIESLAGTPVQLQVVRFETYSGILGSSQWHDYYDMTDASDVSTLLAAVSDLQGSWSTYPRGGTNWEEGLFRSFHNADGSIAQTIPNTIVFFTDGVPTFDRLVQRTSPGALPTLPGDPGDQWPDSTGSSYSQVAFNRANYIANKFRRSVRFIGVGVGAGIDTAQRSNWIVDPGAGYVWESERGYVRYQQVGNGFQTNLDFEEGWDTESRVDYEYYNWGWRNTGPEEYYANNTSSSSWDGWRINGTRGWYNVSQWEFDNYAHLHPGLFKYDDWGNIDAAEYHANNTTSDDSDGYRIDGTRGSWVDVDEALYNAYNTDPGANDGWRIGGSATEWITEAEYLANNTTADASDGYVDTGSEHWVSASQALAWAPWSGSQVGNSNQYRTVKAYPETGPYDGVDTAVTASTQNRVILARLIAGNDYGTPAIWDPAANAGAGGYTNIEVADLYLEPDWNRFPTAMQAIALGECGGTLTLQTKLTDGSPAPDPFRYQNSAVTDVAGDPVELEPSVVTTDAVFRTGTFDFAIPGGQYIDVDILPQNFSELTGYNPGSWSCTAGVDNRPVTIIDVPDSGDWQGIRVRVSANEAVSCTMTVSQ